MSDQNDSVVEGNSCRACGADIPDDSPSGMCPGCLAAAALKTERIDEPPPHPWEFAAPAPEVLDALIVGIDIESLIGQGGMGAVYKGRQPALDRAVAVKVLPPELTARDPAFAERFKREAQAMARLNHPNIVTVYEFGETGAGHCYFVMEYVEGTDLHHMIHSGGCTPAEALALVPQVCEGLQYAHDEGIVHRDIKPANILVDTKGRVKLTDFGLAKLLGTESADYSLTATGSTMGTPVYIAPEQMDPDGHPDHRADIYSLGVVFYELLTGQLPRGAFEVPSQKKVEIDVRFDEVVIRAMQTEPEKRYQQVSEVKTRVEEIRSDPARRRKPARQKKSRQPKTNPKRESRRWLNIAAGSAVLACGIWLWAPWDSSDTVDGSNSESPPPEAGNRMVIPIADGVEMAFRWCSPGKFVMGSPETELGHKMPDETQQDVELTKGFWMGETEVTQAQWMALMGENPSAFGEETRPVEGITWQDALDFCSELTASMRKSGRLPSGMKATLPTEAQWEFACRAGTASALNNGKELTAEKGSCPNLDEVAWYSGNSNGTTQSVGQKTANRWGLHDMHGNVGEYCLYGFFLNPQGGKDPQGMTSSERCALRGGWFSAKTNIWCRSASRVGQQSSWRTSYSGFRVALVPVKQAEEAEEPGNAEVVAPPAQVSLDDLAGKHQPGDRLLVPLADGVEMAFRWCPPGKFVMGSLDTEPDRTRRASGWGPNSDRWAKRREVELTKGFWIGETEVTQDQWEAIRLTNPSSFKGAQKPVEGVNWELANEFCSQLTEQARKSGDLPQGWQASLPTEAQWEYACRAGTESALYNGKDSISSENVDELGWYVENSGNETHDVGQKMANPWGLYDMCGNVWEWCLDWFGDTPQGRTDPTGPAEGSMRVSRGSSYDGAPMFFHSAYRYKFEPGGGKGNYGLRVILTQVE